jgi:hypothetical protein
MSALRAYASPFQVRRAFGQCLLNSASILELPGSTSTARARVPVGQCRRLAGRSVRAIHRRAGIPAREQARRTQLRTGCRVGHDGLTAMIAMRDAGQVRPGTRVLINGASGGVGASGRTPALLTLPDHNPV